MGSQVFAAVDGEQVHVLLGAVPPAGDEQGSPAGEGGGDLADHRFRIIHGSELRAICGAFGHHLRLNQRQVRGPQPQARPGEHTHARFFSFNLSGWSSVNHQIFLQG